MLEILRIHGVEFFSNCKPKRMNNAVICKAAINLEEVHKDLVTEEFCLLCSCDWIQLSFVCSQQQNYKEFFFPQRGIFCNITRAFRMKTLCHDGQPDPTSKLALLWAGSWTIFPLRSRNCFYFQPELLGFVILWLFKWGSINEWDSWRLQSKLMFLMLCLDKKSLIWIFL